MMETFEQNKTALLVMDMQTAVIQHIHDCNALTDAVAKAIAYARSINILVVYITVDFRVGMPEVSMRNKMFSASKQRAGSALKGSDMQIDKKLSPLSNDIVVAKKRVSAFSGSDLELILTAQDITHLILTGVSTSGVVLSTLREAADKDFIITVLSDCCTDADYELHLTLLNKVFPVQASVYPLSDWLNVAGEYC